jgi:hypothetical protein
MRRLAVIATIIAVVPTMFAFGTAGRASATAVTGNELVATAAGRSSVSSEYDARWLATVAQVNDKVHRESPHSFLIRIDGESPSEVSESVDVEQWNYVFLDFADGCEAESSGVCQIDVAASSVGVIGDIRTSRGVWLKNSAVALPLHIGPQAALEVLRASGVDGSYRSIRVAQVLGSKRPVYLFDGFESGGVRVVDAITGEFVKR